MPPLHVSFTAQMQAPCICPYHEQHRHLVMLVRKRADGTSPADCIFQHLAWQHVLKHGQLQAACQPERGGE